MITREDFKPKIDSLDSTYLEFKLLTQLPQQPRLNYAVEKVNINRHAGKINLTQNPLALAYSE